MACNDGGEEDSDRATPVVIPIDDYLNSCHVALGELLGLAGTSTAPAKEMEAIVSSNLSVRNKVVNSARVVVRPLTVITASLNRDASRDASRAMADVAWIILKKNFL